MNSKSSLIIIAFINFLLLIAGMLCAIWFRLKFAFGAALGADYHPWPLSMTGVLLVATSASYGSVFVLSRWPRIGAVLAVWRRFRVLMLSAVIASIAIFFLLPDVSLLQIGYFSIATGIVGILVIVLPERLRTTAYTQTTVADNARDLWAHHHLLLIWLKYNIEARYRQTILGIVWIILFPLTNSIVLAFAFTNLLGAKKILDVPFVVFFLSGFVSFGVFQTIVTKSKGAILSSTGLIKQVYFPKEILIFLLVGEALVDFIFTFAAMILILLIFYQSRINLYYTLIPIPLFILAALATGLAFLISWFSMIIRDLEQLIGIFVQLLFFATVLYSPGRVSDPTVSRIMALNPVAAPVVAFRDIVLYARAPDCVSLYLSGVLAVVLLYLGYVIFKVNEDRFVDMV